MTSGRALLTRVLVLLLVPAVSLATTADAFAASNLNVWETTVVKTDTLAKIDSVECAVTARYTGVAESVEWANSECLGGPDFSPGFAQPGEPGSHATVEFRGTRAGEVADSTVWAGAACGGTTVPGATVQCEGGVIWFTVPGMKPATHRFCIGSMQSPGTMYRLSADGAGNRYGAGVSALQGPDFYTKMIPVPGDCTDAAQQPYTGWPYRTTIKTGWVAPPSTGNQGGEGAGTACKATSSQLTLAEFPGQDGWTGTASLIPNGSAAVAEAVGGVCLFDQVCLTLQSDNGFMPESTSTTCAEADWDEPVAPPAAGDTTTEPTPPPISGHDLPDAPTTEQGFWGALLAAVAGMARGIMRGLSAVVSAVAGVAGAILDGLLGLFVPSAGFFGAQVDGVKDAWDQTPPAVLIGEVTSIPDKLVVPSSSGCEGVAVPLRLPNYTGGERGEATTLHPFTTCDPARQKLADLVRIALQLTVAAGAFLAGVRILGASIGMDTSLGRGADA